jgi:CBS domain containing-hemolysin-like protein
MLNFILILLLMLFAAVTAASETAIIAASRIKLRKMAAEGSRRAKLIIKILEAPERFFGTILVANNIVDVLLASIVTAIMIYLLKDESSGVFFATIIATVIIIISEVTAKTLAAKNSIRMSLALAKTVQFLITIFSPIVKILAVITNALIKLMGGETKGKPSLISEEEIRALIKMGETEDVLHREKYRMLSRVFEFNEAIAKNVMTPKKNMVAIDVDSNLESIVAKVLESGYSRLPVYKGDPDNIIGVINMKDILSLATSNGLILLHDIIYPPIFVNPSKKVIDLLKDFQKGHAHIAIVVNMAREVEGIVTLEDLLEEIVGDIKDEHDVRSM